jgi:hypothetical protein
LRPGEGLIGSRQNSNVHSTGADELTALATAVDELAAQDLDGLADAACPSGSWSCGGC